MRFLNVDDVERHAIFVLFVELIERGNLPAKRRSSVAAENEDDGLLAAERREANFGGAVGGHQLKIGGRIADAERAIAGLQPEGFKRENEKGQRRHFGHDTVEDNWRLAHYCKQ